MIEFNYKIQDPMGFHARPVGYLSKLVNTQKASVTISYDGKLADARRLYQVLGLGVKQGETIRIIINGEDEEVLRKLILSLFEEQQL